MSSTDKIIRVIIAVIIAVLFFTGTIPGTLGIVLLVLAGILVLTSVVRFCPIYKLFGINTCHTKE